ncbi:hypothetical protein RRG08_007228 [Elysia crispata]|uniref:Uncharacterized protein n=1 Tax=Elysia crispata TaxID=231223 RepID=A0AAE1DL83_9GAST|nr:hypothetical protein RRG08_007228 [Elysia crispata]
MGRQVADQMQLVLQTLLQIEKKQQWENAVPVRVRQDNRPGIQPARADCPKSTRFKPSSEPTNQSAHTLRACSIPCTTG